MLKRDFTGVFIPAHIWTCKELIPSEKMMLGEIAALSTRTGWCEASRAHFAEWLQCDPTNISHYIGKLEKLGFLDVKRTPGARSKMRVVADRFYTDEVVSGIHGSSEPHSRVVVNPIHGSSEPHSPEIKVKDNNKIKLKEKTPTSGESIGLKKDFDKQTVEEQLREVWLYTTNQFKAVELEKISVEEKKVKRERIETVKLALMSEEFRGLIVRYREYRKAMKYRWYKSDATLYATVSNLALLAGTIIVQGEKKINISNAKDIYNYSATEKNYQSFVELPKYLQTPKATQPTASQPTHNTDPQKGIRVYGGSSFPANL